MSRKKGTKVASDGGPELTSTGVPWSEVPGYVTAQLAGAFAASGLLRMLFPADDGLGTTLPAGPT